MTRQRTYVILSQVFVPDPASVGQHIADAAAELASRGHRVIVFTADRGYDDPSQRFARWERYQGVEVIRLPYSSFGKNSLLVRLVAGFSFLIQAVVRAALLKQVNAVVVSTSPPIAVIGGVVLAALKRAKLKYWVMDLNPDQAVAMGVVRPDSFSVRLFEWVNRQALEQASDVVVLDRFMEERVRAKGSIAGRLHILPPWPLEDVSPAVPPAENPWRSAHGIGDEIVVMYSGNHSPANPLRTFLLAAERLRDVPELRFLFVGGGAGKKEVEAMQLPNVSSLPYQPLETLRYSLAAGDVHLVSIGDDLVGIVHPCKAYGAMSVSRPIIALGPKESHLSDLVDNGAIGWKVTHGDVDAAERIFRDLVAQGRTQIKELGERAQALVQRSLSRSTLRKKLCDVLELDVVAK